MKITKKQLINLIETFIVDPEGRTIDYEEILKLEKEYAETEDPEVLRKIDAMKAEYEDLPDDVKYGKEEPYEKETYNQATEIETSLMMQPGIDRGFDDEEAMLAGDLMYKYGKERGQGEYFDNQPGEVKKEEDGGYPTKEKRKKVFFLAKQYKNVDNLIGDYVNDWLDNNKESLSYESEVDNIANEIIYEILLDKGYDDYSDLLEQDQSFSEVFEYDENFFNEVINKIIEYCINNEDYTITGIEGMMIVNPKGGYYNTSGYSQPGGDVTVTYQG